MRLALAIAFSLGLIANANAQNPPTNYTAQSTPYDATSTWYCEIVTGTLNRSCSFSGITTSITSLPNLVVTQSNLTTAPAATISTPADPTGTTSATGVMMGLAGTITPATTGKVIVAAYGVVQTNTGTKQCQMNIRTGTGTAPANGAALTGTAVGSVQQQTTISAANSPTSYAMTVVVTGLTISTARWIDVSLASVDGATQCNLFSNTITAAEL